MQALNNSNENFEMKIELISDVPGIGVSVTGTIESGKCELGEHALIIRGYQKLPVFISHIDLLEPKRKLDNKYWRYLYAYAGENVVLTLSGVTIEQIMEGDILIINK